MSNLSELAQATSGIQALSGLILVNPQNQGGYQPQNPPNATDQSLVPPPAFLFDYEGENSITLKSDITDHFVEDNTTIQDQIALRPEMVSVGGFVGELNDVAPALLAPLKNVADKLTAIGGYTPVISTTALIAYNEAFFLYQIASSGANSAVSAISSLLGGEPTQNKQQIAFVTFYGYWLNRVLFTLQTPWAKFTDMAIETLRAIQDSETNVITNFEITFKKIRFADTLVLGSNTTGFFQGRAITQSAVLSDLGVSTPPLSQKTLLQGIAGSLA